jgi:tetratricopeptide (TPR) repeat protein
MVGTSQGNGKTLPHHFLIDSERKRQAEGWLRRGRAYQKRHGFQESEICLLTAINILEEQVGEGDMMLVDALAMLANLYIEMARFDEAEEFLDRALDGAAKAGAGSQVLAFLTNNKGGALREGGRTQEALATFRKAAEIDPEGMGYAQAIENAALCLSEMAQIDEARPLFEEALSIRLRHLPEGDLIVVRNMNNLGLLERRAGNYDLASRWFDKAAALLGEQQETVSLRAIILNNRATLSQELGDFDSAAAKFREALPLSMSVYGEEHPTTLTHLSNYGMLLSDTGNYDEAEPLLTRVASVRERVGHPRDHATSLNILGLLYLRMGRLSEAKTFLQRAVELNRAAGTDVSPFQLTVPQNNLALVFLQTGEFEAARRLLEDVVAKRREILPPSSDGRAGIVQSRDSSRTDGRLGGGSTVAGRSC